MGRLLLLALALAGIAASAQAARETIWTQPKVARGTVSMFYITTIRGWVYPLEDRIFDGDRWLPLTSEPGWRLYIDLQREQDPDAME